MTRLIVGDGPVARGLAAALAHAGQPPLRWHRAGAIPAADEIVLAVRDAAVREVGERVAAAQPVPPILLHCAGALPSAVLDGLGARGVALVHPLRSFAGAAADAQLEGTVFGVEGDAVGRAAALALVAAVGGIALVLEPAQLALYHAAAVLVSNHAVGLVDAAVALLGALGLEPGAATGALAALLASTAANLAAVGLPAALTGPIARGDTAVVRRHLDALPADARALYRATARRVLDVATAKGRAPAAALATIRAMIDEP